MKKVLPIILAVILSLNAQALFEVKDASDHSVFEITNDGIRIFNYPDTLMIISSAEIRANLDNTGKGLSRSFSVSTNATGKGNLAHVLEVGTKSTTMREGVEGNQYTNFSPENIFLGLNAGQYTFPDVINLYDVGIDNLFIGNNAGFTHTTGTENIFIGKNSGYTTNYGSRNVFLGLDAGYNNKTGADNVYIGKEAGRGYQSGSIYSNGSSNIAIGVKAGFAIKTAGHNVMTGYWAGYNTTDGDQNIFLGNLSGYTNTIESNNVYLGYAAAAFNAGEKNVILGSGDDDHMPPSNRAMSGSVFLGFGAGAYETNSNRLHIDNSANATPLIYGEFDNNLIRINGDFNVTGTTTVNGLFKVNTIEITDMGSNSLGVDGDIIQYNGASTAFDLGNNNATEHWDDVVAETYITYVPAKSKGYAKSIDSGLDRLMMLRPVTYNLDRKIFGLIPEEVENFIPEAIISQDIDIDPETGKLIITETDKGIVYNQFIPVLIKSIQEQQGVIETQQKMIDLLEERIGKLENK